MLFVLVFGSPPHAWGQCVYLSQPIRIIRFTPTCVGTIDVNPFILFMASVHPHMRGDNDLLRIPTEKEIGSPPHAWGQWTCPTPCPIRPPVHPHMRGDNSRYTLGSAAEAGSPPHAWGQCQGIPGNIPSRRFTPTCVGTIINHAVNRIAQAVHPHMRGDNWFDGSHGHRPIGSPPHAWGQWCKTPVYLQPVRFTPTCVGTIRANSNRRRVNAVHPHMRGDNMGSRRSPERHHGSPPHAWGQCCR